ncbi:MAG: hypothetical protein K5984_05320 [Bacteroidales bacterium]|nr:hypothetical protein [Bacteroidales bacterium]
MLKNKLYTLVSISGDEAVIRINPDAEILKAHFPGYPIVPGVCVARIATELMQEIMGSLRLVSASGIRFLNPVFPDGKDLKYRFQKDGMKVCVEVENEEEKKARLNLEYERPDSAHI